MPQVSRYTSANHPSIADVPDMVKSHIVDSKPVQIQFPNKTSCEISLIELSYMMSYLADSDDPREQRLYRKLSNTVHWDCY